MKGGRLGIRSGNFLGIHFLYAVFFAWKPGDDTDILVPVTNVLEGLENPKYEKLIGA
jgi:hypothetical protein